MPLTCANWLSVLEPRLTEPLFDSGPVRQLHGLARDLPGECLGTLEVRLAADAAPVDLSMRLRTADEAYALAVRLPSSPIGKFLSRWSQLEGPLAPVRSVWLEFDLDRALPGEVPIPVICAKLPKDADPDWLTDTLFPALQGGPLAAGQRALVRACLSALPRSTSLLYVFSLRARGSDAVRLEIFGTNPDQLLDYLQRVAPRALSAAAAVAPFFAGVERLHLSFDVAEEILPRIGIEGSFPRQPPRETCWKDLLTCLLLEGLCSPEKRDALLAWPGYDTFWTAAERWPISQKGPQGVCVRTLSHVKIVCHPDCEPEAKAYLAFGPLDGSSEVAPAS